MIRAVWRRKDLIPGADMHHAVEIDDVDTPLLKYSSWTYEKMDPSDPVRTSPPTTQNFTIPNYTWARKDKNGRKFPQSIAHRGYKAEHPENTLRAFQGAVEIGAHAIETDIHLSKDDVVVLSHDADLKRCFDQQEKIIDCNWDYLSTLRTKKAPHEPMPRLKDLLEYIAQPGLEYIWILLDIKVDNDAEKVMELIAKTIKSVPAGARPWQDRIVLGIWVAKYLPLCPKYLSGYPVSFIGFSTCYARTFLDVPGISFNMFQKVLFGPIGAGFIRDVRKAKRPLLVWTVNEVNLMKWSIQKNVDGVITDDPKLFNQVCREYGNDEAPARVSWTQWLYTFWLYVLMGVYFISFRRRFPETVEQFLKSSELSAMTTLKLEA